MYKNKKDALFDDLKLIYYDKSWFMALKKSYKPNIKKSSKSVTHCRKSRKRISAPNLVNEYPLSCAKTKSAHISAKKGS